MSLTGGEIVRRALEDEEVALAFGIPGTHNIELYDALALSSTVRTVLITDEQSAGFLADGAWRASGRLACVNIVPGAGLTHALSGIAEAFMDGVPMLVLGCGIRRDTGRAYQLHDVDQLAIAAPITKGTFLPLTGAELYASIRRACALARSGTPGPAMVEVPADLYLKTHDVDLEREASAFEPLPAPEPAAAAVELAARLLNSARRPFIYAGMGAAGASGELLAVAEKLEAPVASTISGKGVFPESHPLSLWPGFGDAAPPFARRIAADRDATLAIGCRFGEVATGSYGLVPPGKLIHVDIDPDVIGRNHPAELAIGCDAGEFIRALLPLLEARNPDQSLRQRIHEGREGVRREQLEGGDAARVSPYRLMARLQARLSPNAIYSTDSGNGTFIAMEGLRLEAPGRFLAPVDYSCMGYSVPAAIGARLARPDAPVVVLAGDGAFLMTGLELLTAANQGAPVAAFVLRDRELAQIAQFQSVAMNRKTASVLPDYDLAPLARSLGIECIALDSNDALDDVIDRVLAITASGAPVVIDVAVDYSVKTFFTRGVVRTNLGRLPWRDRLRFIGRAVARRITG